MRLFRADLNRHTAAKKNKSTLVFSFHLLNFNLRVKPHGEVPMWRVL